MSFVRQYRRFLRVGFEDDGGDAVDAFDVLPTTRTRAIMADHALTFRPETAGFSIYSRNNPDAADPLIGPISDRTRLSFGLRIKDPPFPQTYCSLRMKKSVSNCRQSLTRLLNLPRKSNRFRSKDHRTRR